MVNNEIVSRIAQKIRAVRLKRKLTIQQLAEKANVTKGLLSKIENSRTVPSLPLFVQILDSLDVSLKEFFNDMVVSNGRKYLMIRESEYPKLEREGRKGLDYRYIISQNIGPSTMEILLLTMQPGLRGRPEISDGHEFRHVISGRCDFHISSETVKMEQGDSVFFDASVPHLLFNFSSEEVVMLVVYFHPEKS